MNNCGLRSRRYVEQGMGRQSADYFLPPYPFLVYMRESVHTFPTYTLQKNVFNVDILIPNLLCFFPRH